MKKNTCVKHISYFMFIVFVLSAFSVQTIYSQPLQTPEIHAEAAILMDAKTGKILYEKNAHTQHYPASITKLMTALLVIENLKPTDTLTFSRESILDIDPLSSRIGMRVGEQITVNQALHGLLLMSANEVAAALAEAVSGSVDNFAVLMTQKAHALGAKNTQFVNPHGLHDLQHYTTAYDMALITQTLYNNPYFLEIMGQPVYQIPPTNKCADVRYLSQEHPLMNERRDSQRFRSDVIGGKTGYTNEARHTLVTTARRGEVDLIAVLLKSEKQFLASDTSKLLDFGFNSYHTIKLHDQNTRLTSLPVYTIRSGEVFEAAKCHISVAQTNTILVSRDIRLKDISTKLNIPDYLTLGVVKNEKIGTIDYIYKNEILATDDLIVHTIDFTPSPFTINRPPKATTGSVPSWLIGTCISLLCLLVFIHFKSRPKPLPKKKYVPLYKKHKKLKFSKTMK